MRLYGIVGAGGYGREVMPMVTNLDKCIGMRVVFVVENSLFKEVNGYEVLTPSEFLSCNGYAEKYFNIAIGDSLVRERIANELMANGAIPFTVKHANSIVYPSSLIHDSAILSPFTCITADAKIGKFFHANLYSYVAHDCIIGDFVTFAPGVKCNGSVVIEDHVYVGTGAVIKQGTPKRPIVIGKGAVIGMGSVVTKSVLPGATVFGNPAKPLTKRDFK